MKQAPVHVVQAIHRIDPRLRIRWSREKRKFAVERKVDSSNRNLLPLPVKYKKIGPFYDMIKYPEYSERYVCWHDGYFPILYTNRPDSRLVFLLRMQDAHRLGMKDAIYQQDRMEAKEELREEQKEVETIREVAGEAYDTLHWKQGERMGMAI